MKAIVYSGIRVKKDDEPTVYLIYIPEAEIVSTADHTSVMCDARSDQYLRFLQKSADRIICEFDVPFNLVARMYCLVHDFSPSQMKKADTILWNELVKELMEIYRHNRRIEAKQK